MKPDSTIYVAGHSGLVGSAVVRVLRAAGHTRLLLRSHAELDLTRQSEVLDFLAAERPEYIFHCAGRVGGIQANSARGADFIRDNLLMATNIIEGAWRAGTAKLLVLGSSCMYPRACPQPAKEEYLFTGPLEPTNQPYAVAKLATLELARAHRAQHGLNVICAIPTNAYGPGDNFDPEASHVIPGLLRRFAAAQAAGEAEVSVWGSGQPVREFIHSDDLAAALLHLMRHYDSPEPLNVGTGSGIRIAELAQAVAEVVGLEARLVFDAGKPDGMPVKMLDSSRVLALGWQPRIALREGLADTWRWYRQQAGA